MRNTAVGKQLVSLALVIAALAGSRTSGAAEVNGIWSEATTKDLGELTGYDLLNGWKIRGWAEAYYVWNFNQPHDSTVDANQGSSIIKGDDVSIEARTFDVRHNEPTLTMLEMELEKVPQLSGWLDPKAFGLKLDANYGDAYDIIYHSVQGGIGVNSLNSVDRYLSHYSVSYVAPIGNGLRVDFGKLVTHIGGETIESIKNNNFSHGYLYSYAIPFQDLGFRVSYPWSDTVSTEFYALQGWNMTWDDNNTGKTFGPSILWAPSPKLALYANYLFGPEQSSNTSNYRHLLDLGAGINPCEGFNVLLSFDYGHEDDALGNSKSADWVGAFSVFRYKVTDAFEPALRLEVMRDYQGFATGVDQTLFGVTLTLNYRFDLPGGVHLLLRPEYRFDNSNAQFFTHQANFRSRGSQHTLGIGTVLYF